MGLCVCFSPLQTLDRALQGPSSLWGVLLVPSASWAVLAPRKFKGGLLLPNLAVPGTSTVWRHMQCL